MVSLTAGAATPPATTGHCRRAITFAQRDLIGASDLDELAQAQQRYDL
jgi:hypothetical protein